MKASDLFVRALEREGVEYVFGIPGEENLDLCVVVLRDDSYGMIRWKQGEAGFDDWGLEFGNPDFVAYAESYGARGHRVERVGQLAELLRSCHDEGGVHLIETPIDYSDDARLLGEELANEVCVL